MPAAHTVPGQALKIYSGTVIGSPWTAKYHRLNYRLGVATLLTDAEERILTTDIPGDISNNETSW